MKKLLLSLFLVILCSCSQKEVNLTFKSGLMAEEVILSNKEKNQIIEFLSNYEFKELHREGYYYGGTLYDVEYELDGMVHHWCVSGSASDSYMKEKENRIDYITYDINIIHELSKYVK